MYSSDLTCWKCGATLTDLLLPVSRLAKCKACNADLHVCRICRFYDITVSNSCTEPVADKVIDKQHKNFCGFFQPDPRAGYKPSLADKDASKNQLNALFGLGSDSKDQEPALTPEEQARRKLADLFGIKDDKSGPA